MQQRQMIQRQGQIMRKEFMLHDRSNWPVISVPTGPSHARLPSNPKMPMNAGDTSLEEEDDVSRGDLLDFMTPRDISKTRFEQHHEWMEEILESQYAISQILPSDLGLGRKGELEALTSEFFEAPMAVFPEARAEEKIGNGIPTARQAEAFRSKATNKLAAMQDDLAAMKKKHSRTVRKLTKASKLGAAEKRLRTASHEEQQSQTIQTTEDIVQEIEDEWKRPIEQIPMVKLVEKGGLEPPSSTSPFAPTPTSATKSTFSPTKTVMSPSTTYQPLGDMIARPTNVPVTHPPMLTQPNVPDQEASHSQQTPEATLNLPGDDVHNMEETTAVEEDTLDLPKPAEPRETTPALGSQPDEMEVDAQMTEEVSQADIKGNEVDDNAWVMVDEDNSPHDTPRLSTDNAGDLSSPADRDLVVSTDSNSESLTVNNPQQTELVSQAALQDTTELSPSTNPAATAEPEQEDFDMSNDFDNEDNGVDTMGDELAGYGSGAEELNFENLEDSAFGDAFHPPEDERNTPRVDDQEIS